MKCSLGISNFLKRSLVFPILFFSLYFFALIAEEGFLISPCYSLELCIQILCFSLLFFSQLFAKVGSQETSGVTGKFGLGVQNETGQRLSSDSHFAFLHFFFLEMVLIPISCTMSRTSVHSSSGTLSDLVP